MNPSLFYEAFPQIPALKKGCFRLSVSGGGTRSLLSIMRVLALMFFCLRCSEIKNVYPPERNDNFLFGPVETPPEFPGGLKEQEAFIERNLRNLPDCPEGEVFVAFTVEMDGKVTSERVVRSLSREADHEALRIVKLFPDFTPGRLRGNPVKTKMVVPIRFK